MYSLPLMPKSLDKLSSDKKKGRKSSASSVLSSDKIYLSIKSPLRNNFVGNNSSLHITPKSTQSRKSSSKGLLSTESRRTQNERTSSSKRRSATRKIGRFLNKTATFLKLICANSGECVSFGKKIDEITAFFDGYTGFGHVKDAITSIGVPSNNGFVKEITYEKDGYKSYAVLKSSMRQNADNLVYEYIVGSEYINGLLQQFPCFVQTYGHYFYKDHTSWDIFLQEDKNSLSKKDLTDALEVQDSIDLEQACLKSNYAAILIQHIHSAKTLNNHIHDTSRTSFVEYDLLYILFIIYHALSKISTTFTHYDLHSNNVLLYEPVKGKYIQYHYHLSDEIIITFRCPFIPKIIDYGRSYFHTDSNSSEKVFEKIQSTEKCQPYNGYTFGFQWFRSTDPYFIISQKKNESHDLRLLVNIKNSVSHFISASNTHNEVSKLLESLQYGVDIDTTVSDNDMFEAGKRLIDFYKKNGYHENEIRKFINDENNFQSEAREIAEKEALKRALYGTKENTTLNEDGSITANVRDAYISLSKSVLKPDVIAENLRVYSDESKKFADFHIYGDGRPMEFSPVRLFRHNR